MRLSVSLVTGSLPSTFTNAVHLRTLSCQENMLTGTLPPTIGSLPELYALILFTNKLEGEVPPSLGQSRTLQMLYLNKNSFTALPWGSLDHWRESALRYVVLANNLIEVSLNHAQLELVWGKPVLTSSLKVELRERPQKTLSGGNSHERRANFAQLVVVPLGVTPRSILSSTLFAGLCALSCCFPCLA